MALLNRDPAARAIKHLVERSPHRPTVDLTPGSMVVGLVLGSTNETTTVVDLESQAIVRWRIPWPADFETDLASSTSSKASWPQTSSATTSPSRNP